MVESMSMAKETTYEPPESGDLPEAGKKILAAVYSKAREDGYDKERSAKIAWGAVRRAGYESKSYAKEDMRLLEDPDYDQEKMEHPSFTDEQIQQIVEDHKKLRESEKKSRDAMDNPSGEQIDPKTADDEVRPLQKPFGKYKDFDQCVAQNQDASSPESYCAAIHKKITGKWPTEKERIKEACIKCGEKCMFREEATSEEEKPLQKDLNLTTDKIPEVDVMVSTKKDEEAKVKEEAKIKEEAKKEDEVTPVHDKMDEVLTILKAIASKLEAKEEEEETDAKPAPKLPVEQITQEAKVKGEEEEEAKLLKAKIPTPTTKEMLKDDTRPVSTMPYNPDAVKSGKEKTQEELAMEIAGGKTTLTSREIAARGLF
jgi:hypothetical protein